MAKKKQNLSPEEMLEEALVPEHEWPYGVPENWVWVKLGGICKLNNGEKIKGMDMPYLEVKVLRGKCEAIIKNSGAFVSRGSKVILVDGENSGEVFHIDIDGYMGSTFKKLEIVDIANNDFVEYFITMYKDEFRNSKVGSAIPHLNKNLFSNLCFAFPPLAEQQRIVVRIECLFEKLDQAKGLIQDVLDSFENRKDAILHKAFSGELTKKWREENGVGKESWEEKRFEEFCFLNRGFDLPSSQRTKGKYDLVTSSGITDSHIEFKVSGPGVVTGRSGTIGKVFYIENDYWPLNTTLYSKETYGNNVKFIYYHLLTFDFKNYSSSTAVPTLNRNNFSDVLVLVPSLEEQNEIVRVLDRIIDLERSALQLCQLTEAIETIKNSILNRAFRGEFGTNDNDEESSIELIFESILKTKNNEENKIVQIIKPEVSVMSLTIIDALQKHGRLTPEQLKEITKQEIDDFYDELKRLINESLIIEIRKNDDVYLEVINK